MKKILSLMATVMLIALASCSKGYKVNGTIEGSQDGDVVRILVFNDGKLDTLHVLNIKDEKFTFSGQIDSIVYAIVDYEGADGLQKSSAFFLENANIHIEFPNDTLKNSFYNQNARISGTLINERKTQLDEKYFELTDQISQFVDNADVENMNEEEKKAFSEQYEQLSAKVEDLYKNFIRENIDNFAGQFYLNFVAPAFDDEFVREQLAAIPEGKATYVIRELQEQISLMANTAVGQPFIDFSAPTPQGETLSVAKVAKDAKLLMIDFWASWCGPCRAEMPNVKTTYEKYHAQGFEILGVSLDEKASDWKEAIDALGMTWPQISDLGGWDSQGASLYGVQAIPATVLIRDGKIVARDVRGDDLAPKVEELLK